MDKLSYIRVFPHNLACKLWWYTNWGIPSWVYLHAGMSNRIACLFLSQRSLSRRGEFSPQRWHLCRSLALSLSLSSQYLLLSIMGSRFCYEILRFLSPQQISPLGLQHYAEMGIGFLAGGDLMQNPRNQRQISTKRDKLQRRKSLSLKMLGTHLPVSYQFSVLCSSSLG